MRTTPGLATRAYRNVDCRTVDLRSVCKVLTSSGTGDLPALRVLCRRVDRTLLTTVAHFRRFSVREPAKRACCLSGFLRRFTEVSTLTNLQLQIARSRSSGSRMVANSTYDVSVGNYLRLHRSGNGVSTLFANHVSIVHRT